MGVAKLTRAEVLHGDTLAVALACCEASDVGAVMLMPAMPGQMLVTFTVVPVAALEVLAVTELVSLGADGVQIGVAFAMQEDHVPVLMFAVGRTVGEGAVAVRSYAMPLADICATFVNLR